MVNEQIQILMEGLDETNIVSILDKWKEISSVRKQLDEWENALKEKVKAHLKERQWKTYQCKENNINVSLTIEKRETVDLNQLKLIVTPGQLSQVTRTTSFEKLLITTSETRDKMKKFMKR
jgi:hypothetical protein